ncbi:MAG TPA: isochorismate lyase [Bryobacteraceae bacterium]|jgi:isochorismate pyruvate lyase|nr:isochorismate lyase [Bryobacteraceae bacterium]
MPTPEQCRSIEEVRAEIDRIDRRIVALLGERAGYVHAAARFKPTEEAVAAPERQAAMFAARREWAREEDLDPDFIERLYRELIAYFVQREREHWKTL